MRKNINWVFRLLQDFRLIYGQSQGAKPCPLHEPIEYLLTKRQQDVGLDKDNQKSVDDLLDLLVKGVFSLHICKYLENSL